MPAALSYPGVYVEEISSGVRTIVSVPTSVTAFVGRTSKGPFDEATDITSWVDFERKFGGLWQDSQLSFAVRDFYLNGGSRAVIVRLFQPAFDSDDERTAAVAAIAPMKAALTAAGIDTGQKVKEAFDKKFGNKSDSPDKDTIWGKVNKAKKAFDDADAEVTAHPGDEAKKTALKSAKAKLDAENAGLKAAQKMKGVINNLADDAKDEQGETPIQDAIKLAEATALPNDKRELDVGNLKLLTVFCCSLASSANFPVKFAVCLVPAKL